MIPSVRRRNMLVHEVCNELHIRWFPSEFSQSRYGRFRASGTNSCTLICLILADSMSKERRIILQNCSELPQHVINLFGTAMDEGNSVYEQALNDARTGINVNASENFNVPDALTVLRKQPSLNFHLQEWFYTQIYADPTKESYKGSVAGRLAAVLDMGLQVFRESTARDAHPSHQLFAVLIGALRTVIFVFEVRMNLVVLFDSHRHGWQRGAIVAQCPVTSIMDLCRWYVHMVECMYGLKAPSYEISFLTTHREKLLKVPNIDGWCV